METRSFGDPAASGGWPVLDATNTEIGALMIDAPRELRQMRKALEARIAARDTSRVLGEGA